MAKIAAIINFQLADVHAGEPMAKIDGIGARLWSKIHQIYLYSI